MWTILSDSLIYFSSQSASSLLLMFWVVAIFEAPRYALLFAVTAFIQFMPRRSGGQSRPDMRVSMVIAGHNEAAAAETCVLGLHEQSRPPDEIIIVSDGSTDGMQERIRRLRAQGLIDQTHSLQLRSGKAAAVNLAVRHATGDILINVDLDCSFDRDAIEQIVAPFMDPAVGATCGNLMVRNQTATMITAFQAIEYLINISLGKKASMITNQVTCVSGAFGAFRKTALDSVGGMDCGSGEDLDCTVRLRKAGWKIAFAADAIAYTEVPATLPALMRQRFRWERDALRLRMRKHGEQINPFSPRMRFTEFLHEAEFLLFNLAAAIAMPVYIVWLFLAYGDTAPVILIAAQIGLFVLDTITFFLAAALTPRAKTLAILPYLPAYSLFSAVIMRFVRLAAYLQEWLFDGSSKDSYVPGKVNLMRRW